MRLHDMILRSALCATLLAPAAAAARVELPVREVDLPNGDRRFTTTVMIDGQPVEVGIDTGSPGLRVLPRGLSATGGAAKGPRLSYSYGAGTGFDGMAITVPIAAGTIGGKVTVMRITGVGCTRAHPDCPVAHADLSAYGIQGDGLPGRGFAAILGIRLQDDPIANPFVQLGIRRWIVELPRTAAETGRIVLDPDDAEIAAYQSVPVAEDGTTTGCLIGPDKICGRAFFDSGAAGMRVIRSARFVPWPDGTPADITIGAGTAEQRMRVTIGRRDQASALHYVPAGVDTRLSFGFAPYYHWSVLYDAEHHRIGLKPRSPTNGGS